MSVKIFRIFPMGLYRFFQYAAVKSTTLAIQEAFTR